jgi:non-heme chloroperoxidase
VFLRIKVPTLFIGAKGSLVPYRAMLWESTQVPGSQTAIFEADEGGSHFMFIENPSKFNGLISSFMG